MRPFHDILEDVRMGKSTPSHTAGFKSGLKGRRNCKRWAGVHEMRSVFMSWCPRECMLISSAYHQREGCARAFAAGVHGQQQGSQTWASAVLQHCSPAHVECCSHRLREAGHSGSTVTVDIYTGSLDLAPLPLPLSDLDDNSVRECS